MSALGCVVVDNIQDHLNACPVELSNCALELQEHRLRALSPLGLRCVAHVRGEEVDGVVAPVVDKTEIYEPGL